MGKATETSMMTMKLGQLLEPPWNARVTYHGLDELAASIEAVGVLTPLLVRPMKGGKHEVVGGTRRLRAAKLLGMEDLPVLVRDMTDLEAREAQIVENLQREGIHPLEEADAIRSLGDRDAAELAAVLGKDEAFVRRRLQLGNLKQPGRRAYKAGRITDAVAALIASLPEPKDQEQAVEALAAGADGELVGYPQARDYVRDTFMLKLKDAPFDVADAELVEKAGACGDCPKRTLAQEALFEGFDKTDRCLDPKCWQRKVVANWKQRSMAHAKAGGAVLPDDKAARALGRDGALLRPREFVLLGDKCAVDKEGRTYRKLLKGVGPESFTLAKAPSGRVVELVPQKRLPVLMEQAGEPKLAARLAEQAQQERDARKVAAEERSAVQLRRRVCEELGAHCAAHIVDDGVQLAEVDLRFIAAAMLRQAQTAAFAALQRRGVPLGAPDKWLAERSSPELWGLLLDTAIALTAQEAGLQYPKALRDVAKQHGVELKALEKKLADAQEPAKEE